MIYIDDKDDKIIEVFAKWLKESTSYHNEMLKDQKIAEQYYNGNQTGRDLVNDYQSDIVENRVFESIETIVPIATAAAHHFVVKPGSDDEAALARAEKTTKVLTNKYRTLHMQERLEDVVRHMLLMKFGVLEWYWNKHTDNIDVRTIDPREILIPKMRLDPHNLPYVIKALEFTEAEFKEEFPKVDLSETTATTTKIDTGKEEEGEETLKAFEVWTSEMVFWVSGNEVIRKESNPYFDFEGEEKETKETIKNKRGEDIKKIKKELIFRNHFDIPQKPFVFFTTFDIGATPVAKKSLTDIAIPIQDAINVQKRRIIDNIRLMGNGQVYVDSDAFTQEQADNMTNEPGAVFRGEDLASSNRIRREPGVPLPASHFNNLQHSEATFDNIMGTHSASRGQAQGDTLGQDILSRQGDFTRVDLITRVLNRGVDRVANGLVQMMKMYYTDVQLIKIIGEEDAVEFVRFNQDDIDDYIEIDVMSGQTLPMDDVSLRTEAVQLWQLGALDPVTLFERLKFTDPIKASERLVAWKQGQLTAETNARIAEGQAGAAAKAANEPADRSVETPNNVMQRAKENLGGTAPVGNTPKTANNKR